VNLHNEREGFIVKGRVENASIITQSHRVSLVPLRFGAGIKGKVLEAMENGTPFVTTSIGAEAMMTNDNYSYITNDFRAFAKHAIELYTSKERWITAQEQGYTILKEKYGKKEFEEQLIAALVKLEESYIENRLSDLQYNLFSHHSLKSSMYLSKWISEKNKA